MKIIEALKKIDGLRIENGTKWLIFDKEEWVVFQRKKHSKNSKILIKTEEEEYAIRMLIHGHRNPFLKTNYIE
jgi:hypothetical protein